MAKLDVNIAGLSLKNPVLTASGTFGYGLEFADLIDLNRLGGFIVKGTTLLPREGNDYPRIPACFKARSIQARPNFSQVEFWLRRSFRLMKST